MTDRDIIILADSTGHELAPLTHTISQSMLPIGGKPILQHVLESLVATEHRKVYVVASKFVNEIDDFVGTGERWGLNVSTWVSRGDALTSAIVAKHLHLLGSSCIVVDCNTLRDADLNSIIAELNHTDCRSAIAVRNKDPIGVSVHNLSEKNLETDKIIHQEIYEGEYHDVSNLKGFFAASLAVIGLRKPLTLNCSGRERALGLVTGPGTQIQPSCIKVGSVFAGNATVVHKSTEFSGTVVLGSRVVVARGCKIKDAIILDDSFVGENLSIENAIVAGRNFISMDSMCPIELDDHYLLSDMAKAN